MKRIISVMVMFIAVVLFLPDTKGSIVYAASNPYPTYNYYNSASNYQFACTWYVWNQVNERLGISLPNNLGHAGSWYGNLNYPKGSTPKVNSIACWAFSNANPNGHVAYVTGVNANGSFNIVEGGSNWAGNDHGICSRTVNPGAYWPDLGFVYLNGDKPIGSVVDIKASVYSIHSAINNNLVLDVADGKTTNGTNIQTQNYHGGPAQRFNIVKENGYYLIKPQCSNLVLDTAGNSDQPGANVSQWESNGSHGQHWEFVDAGDGYYYIRNYRGTYLDVTGGVNSIQANIQTYSFNGSAAQKWKLVHETRTVDEGYYEIRSTKDNNLVLDILNESQANGGNLNLHEYNGCRAQVFHITKDGTSYKIQPLCSGLFLDTAGNSNVPGANIHQWNDTGAIGQRFKFVITPGGNYYIRSNLGNVLDVTDWKFNSGTNIQSWTFDGGTSQKWKLVKVDPLKFRAATPQTKVSGTNGNVTFRWNSVDRGKYKNIYDVRIYNNSTASGNYYKVAWGVNGTSYSINLPKGTYSVTVAATDTIDHAIYSNAITVPFKVDENGKVSCLSHTWDDGTTTKTATCEESGRTTYHCLVCGETMTKTIAAKGHSWGNWVTIKNPSNTETGLKDRKCSVCGKKEQEIIPKKTGGSNSNQPDVEEQEKKITTQKGDGDPKGSKYGLLCARVKKSAKTSNTLIWNRVNGASGYIIYGNLCGTNYRFVKIAEIKGSSFIHKKLKKGTYYKYLVVAYKDAAGKKTVIATSKTMHAATKGGKVGNCKKLKVNKTKITLKRKKTFKIKAKEVPASKKLKIKRHRKIAFESSNPKIATVTSAGKIKAIKKGSCKIFVYAQNGIYKVVKVTVK